MRCGWKLGLVTALWLLTPVSGWAQGPQAGNVILDANEAIFCVLAALNAAGYDAGISVNTSNDVRMQVRSELAKKDIPAVANLQKFYEEHRVAGDSGAGLGQYVSLALLLGSPPDFRLAVPSSIPSGAIPYDRGASCFQTPAAPVQEHARGIDASSETVVLPAQKNARAVLVFVHFQALFALGQISHPICDGQLHRLGQRKVGVVMGEGGPAIHCAPDAAVVAKDTNPSPTESTSNSVINPRCRFCSVP